MHAGGSVMLWEDFSAVEIWRLLKIEGMLNSVQLDVLIKPAQEPLESQIGVMIPILK